MPARKQIAAVSLHEAAELIPALDLENYGAEHLWEDHESTESQDFALKRFGLEFDESEMTKGEAAFLLDVLVERAAGGLCSLKQAKELHLQGFINSGELTYREAAVKLRAQREEQN